MRGGVFFVLTIFLYLPSCVHSSPKRGRFRSGLWRGGEAAPAPVEYLSAVPGGLLKAAERNGLHPMREAVSLPALDYAGAVSESALRREGEGRSPMDPLRVTGSVGRGVKSSPALRDVGLSSAPADRGNPARRSWMERPAPRDEGNSALRDGATRVPAKGGATFPRGIGGVIAPMPVGPFAPESKTGVPKIAERGAPGRHPSLTKAPTARRSAPPSFSSAAKPGRKPRERRGLRLRRANRTAAVSIAHSLFTRTGLCLGA